MRRTILQFDSRQACGLGLVCAMATCWNTAAFAEVSEHTAMLRITAEELTLPDRESMGLAGVSYLLTLDNGFYGGIGAYGAVTGRRGGFFTGGLEGGAQMHLGRHLALDAGMFVGGGGGGAAPQGGGLMLRPHLGLALDTASGLFGVQLSQVHFPGGDIDSAQFGLSYAYPLTPLFGGGWSGDPPAVFGGDASGDYGRVGHDLVFQMLTYRPPSDTRNTAGAVQDDPMSLVGVQWNRDLGRHAFVNVAAAGAVAGQSDGYAQVLFGAGLRAELAHADVLSVELDVGAGGGGGVDTGGGALAAAVLRFEHRFRNGLSVGAYGGYLDAPDGDFEASMGGIGLGYHYGSPARGASSSGTRYRPRHWRLRVSHQSADPDAGVRRRGGRPDERVDLIGIQIDAMLNQRFYLTGQAYGAYDGNAGGYAAGLVGAGAIVPLREDARLFLSPELTVGAAGGGGIDVGDGLIGQARLGIGWRLGRNTALMFSAGRMIAPEGDYRANLFELGLAYRFSTLEAVD